MRYFRLALFGLALAGCGGAPSEETAKSEQGVTDPVKERWCRSYKSERYCPKTVCAWHTTPAPGYCSSELITE